MWFRNEYKSDMSLIQIEGQLISMQGLCDYRNCVIRVTEIVLRVNNWLLR